MNQNLSTARIDRAWSSSPLALDRVAVSAKLAILINAHAVRDVGDRAVLSRVTFEQSLTQIFDTVWDLNRIAIRAELRQNLQQARKYIEVGSSSDISLVRRKAKDQEGQTQILAPSNPQPIPASEPSRDSFATFLKRLRLRAPFTQAAVDEWLGSAINLRYRHLHRSLNRVQSDLALLPILDRLNVE